MINCEPLVAQLLSVHFSSLNNDLGKYATDTYVYTDSDAYLPSRQFFILISNFTKIFYRSYTTLFDYYRAGDLSTHINNPLSSLYAYS